MSWMAQTGALAVLATTWKPGGTTATWSPWLIHTGLCPSTKKLSNSGPGVPVACRSAWPNSRFPAGTTWPPKWRLISCMP